MASNDLAVPIAVVYDADGSVTDLLLGEGASDPSGCRQTGVTESVDAFGQAGTIDHAVMVVNGRCVSGGVALQQQMLQLQYQMTRAFGRVLGMAWSQLNDNVFTGATPATLAERQAWPLMHPIDIICGPYTYQCMVNPFVLREDDIAALDVLYPVPSTNVPAGKTWTLQNAVALGGVDTVSEWARDGPTECDSDAKLCGHGVCAAVAGGVGGYGDARAGELWQPGDGTAAGGYAGLVGLGLAVVLFGGGGSTWATRATCG